MNDRVIGDFKLMVAGEDKSGRAMYCLTRVTGIEPDSSNVHVPKDWDEDERLPFERAAPVADPPGGPAEVPLMP